MGLLLSTCFEIAESFCCPGFLELPSEDLFDIFSFLFSLLVYKVLTREKQKKTEREIYRAGINTQSNLSFNSVLDQFHVALATGYCRTTTFTF
jgi:hypothetical protein